MTIVEALDNISEKNHKIRRKSWNPAWYIYLFHHVLFLHTPDRDNYYVGFDYDDLIAEDWEIK